MYIKLNIKLYIYINIYFIVTMVKVSVFTIESRGLNLSRGQ